MSDLSLSRSNGGSGASDGDVEYKHLNLGFLYLRVFLILFMSTIVNDDSVSVRCDMYNQNKFTIAVGLFSINLTMVFWPTSIGPAPEPLFPDKLSRTYSSKMFREVNALHDHLYIQLTSTAHSLKLITLHVGRDVFTPLELPYIHFLNTKQAY